MPRKENHTIFPLEKKEQLTNPLIDVRTSNWDEWAKR